MTKQDEAIRVDIHVPINGLPDAGYGWLRGTQRHREMERGHAGDEADGTLRKLLPLRPTLWTEHARCALMQV